MATSSTNAEDTGAKLANVPTIKAYNNKDFLSSPTARHIRVLCELQEPMKRLADTGVDNYVIFLGSHLAMHPDERNARIAEYAAQVAKGGPREEVEAVEAKLRFSKTMLNMDKYYLVAQDLGARVARWNKERVAKGLSSYHVCTGGGPGIMEAANKGAAEEGAVTLGFGVTRPEWGGLNKYVSEEGAFEFHYFFMRKFWMAYKCMALFVFPGGFGCLDEVFEFLMLLSNQKISHKLPVILMGKEHWHKTFNFEYLLECGMLTKSQVDLLKFCDTADEAFEYMVSQVQGAEAHGQNQVVEDAKRRRLSKTPSGGSKV